MEGVGELENEYKLKIERGKENILVRENTSEQGSKIQNLL